MCQEKNQLFSAYVSELQLIGSNFNSSSVEPVDVSQPGRIEEVKIKVEAFEGDESYDRFCGVKEETGCVEDTGDPLDVGVMGCQSDIQDGYPGCSVGVKEEVEEAEPRDGGKDSGEILERQGQF